MKKVFVLFCLAILACINLVAQEWQKKESTFFKQKENIFFIVDSAINSIERERIVDKTKTYIQKDLELLQEGDLTEPLSIVFFGSRGEMHRRTGKRNSSFSMLKNADSPINSIGVIYDSLYCPLNRELIKMIISTKWGDMKDSRLTWLREGLSTYATPEADDCNGYTLEDKYAYLLQNDKLIDLEQFPVNEISPDYKAARIQAAYIVSILLEKYGIEKLKRLWLDGIDSFETIFEESLDSITQKLNENSQSKYKEVIPMGWQTLTSDCINPQPDDWLAAYNLKSSDSQSVEKKVTKIVQNLKFTMDSTIYINERNYIISKIKKDISDNLKIVEESVLNDSIHILLTNSVEETKNYVGFEVGGIAIQKNEIFNENIIICVYGGKYFPIKHELMHMVTFLKWGSPVNPMEWLIEGIAIFSDSAIHCDGRTSEEKYTYLYQNKILLDIDELMLFDSYHDIVKSKKAYFQSAYIVEYILKKYGVKKIKQLWQKGMEDFENIFDISFRQMIDNINSEIQKKHSNRIELDWDEFIRGCIKVF